MIGNPLQDALPAPGTKERYRALEWLNFIATDLHKGYATLFLPFLADASKARYRRDGPCSRT